MTDQTSFSSPTPLTPPQLDEDRLSWLRLLRSRRVGVATFYRLMAEHGSAGAALAALPGVAAAAGVTDYSPTDESRAQIEMRAAARFGARMICRGEPDYPAELDRIDDAPPLIWARGDLAQLRRPMVAMVGARNASSLGERTARMLAGALGEAGYVVVSGLARGIDGAAHGAALETGTVAVLGGGVDVIYPRENSALHGDIAKRGVLVSEQPMGLAPQARHFPARNRLISGMARGLVVVEAAARSGSLITARDAGDQGRDVMAVPGHPFDARASGCNMLIRDGATLVRNVDDVLEVLGAAETPTVTPIRTSPAPQDSPERSIQQTTPRSAPRPKDAARLHDMILARLGPSPISEDQLLRDLAMPNGAVSPALLDLELDGRVLRQPGGLLSSRA
ncbi:MAG: DNA-processing protein DprA [Rhodobacteraceae bacterium]|nr:DNA-processing protein DprA [Paracoccaceae bacterium]